MSEQLFAGIHALEPLTLRRCQYCKREIVWGKNKADKWVPCSWEGRMRAEGNAPGWILQLHFGMCTARPKRRSKKKPWSRTYKSPSRPAASPSPES